MVSILRRTACFLDLQGFILPYKAQVSPRLEYTALPLISAAPPNSASPIMSISAPSACCPYTWTPLSTIGIPDEIGITALLMRPICPACVSHCVHECKNSTRQLGVARGAEVRVSQYLKTSPAKVVRLWNLLTGITSVVVMSVQEGEGDGLRGEGGPHTLCL